MNSNSSYTRETSGNGLVDLVTVLGDQNTSSLNPIENPMGHTSQATLGLYRLVILVGAFISHDSQTSDGLF